MPDASKCGVPRAGCGLILVSWPDAGSPHTLSSSNAAARPARPARPARLLLTQCAVRILGTLVPWYLACCPGLPRTKPCLEHIPLNSVVEHHSIKLQSIATNRQSPGTAANFDHPSSRSVPQSLRSCRLSSVVCFRPDKLTGQQAILDIFLAHHANRLFIPVVGHT